MQEFSSGQMKFAFGIFLVFCMSMFMSCEELNYWMSGKTAEATVTDRAIVKIPGRRMSEQEKYRIGYKFTDAEGLKREHYLLYEPDDPDIPQDTTLPIEYLHGQYGRSRLAGHHQWMWPILTFAIPVGVVLWCWVYVKQETSRPLSKKRSR